MDSTKNDRISSWKFQSVHSDMRISLEISKMIMEPYALNTTRGWQKLCSRGTKLNYGSKKTRELEAPRCMVFIGKLDARWVRFNSGSQQTPRTFLF